MRPAEIRSVLAPRSGFVNRDIALSHRLSPVSGGVLGLFLGAIAGGLVKQEAKYVIGGGVVGGALGYGLLAAKLSKSDPPEEEPEEEPVEPKVIDAEYEVINTGPLHKSPSKPKPQQVGRPPAQSSQTKSGFGAA